MRASDTLTFLQCGSQYLFTEQVHLRTDSIKNTLQEKKTYLTVIL